MPFALRASAVSLAVVLGFGPAFAEPAVNQFEVKSLDIEQGEVEIEVQSDFSAGQPKRKFVVDEETGEAAFDDNSVTRQRHEIELGFGLANWLRVGGGVELEEERVDDPLSFAEAGRFDSLKATEVSLTGVAVLIPVKDNGIGLGAYAELQLPIETEARTLYIGPIIQAKSGRWSAIGNFAFVKFLGGEREEEVDEATGEEVLLPRDEKWDFAYFTQIKYDATDNFALAVEAYGTIDRIGNSGNATDSAKEIGDQDQHRIGPVVYYTFNGPEKAGAKDDDGEAGGDDDEGGGVTVSAGVLFGLNDNTADTTVKTGLEVGF